MSEQKRKWQHWWPSMKMKKKLFLLFAFVNPKVLQPWGFFFAAVRDKVGFKIKTDCFLSDDANAFFNAWCAEMITDTCPQKRLCAWHVNKNWNTHLSQIPDVPVKSKKLHKSGKPITKRSYCKAQLYSLRSELDLNVFKTKMSDFEELLDGDSAYEKFKDYFVTRRMISGKNHRFQWERNWPRG